MTNDDIKEELCFLHQIINDITVLAHSKNSGRLANLLNERFDYLKDEIIMSLDQYETNKKRQLKLVK